MNSFGIFLKIVSKILRGIAKYVPAIYPLFKAKSEFNNRGTIFNRSSQFVRFVDGMDIVGRTFEKVVYLYIPLERKTPTAGPVVKASKIMYRLVNGVMRDRI